jgi:hypothetical protein
MSKARVEKTIPQFLLIIEDAENLSEQLQEIVTVKTGITTIVDDAVRKTRTSAKAKVLLIATNPVLEEFTIKDFSYKTLD